MSLPRKAFGVQLEKADVMNAGLKNNPDRIARRGLDSAFQTGFEERIQRLLTLNENQEKAKADLKTFTADIERELLELDREYSEAQKVVKLEFPQEQWKEFGITVTR